MPTEKPPKEVPPFPPTTCQECSPLVLPRVCEYRRRASRANIWLCGCEQTRCGTNWDSLAFVSVLHFSKSCCLNGRVNNGFFTFFQILPIIPIFFYFLNIQKHCVFSSTPTSSIFKLSFHQITGGNSSKVTACFSIWSILSKQCLFKASCRQIIMEGNEVP